jgi:hypothetical protein
MCRLGRLNHAHARNDKNDTSDTDRRKDPLHGGVL